MRTNNNSYLLEDEILRQVTVGCLEQGLLLLRVRCELMSRIKCFEKLYKSATLFGLNKSVEAEIQTKVATNQVSFAHLTLEAPLLYLLTGISLD